MPSSISSAPSDSKSATAYIFAVSLTIYAKGKSAAPKEGKTVKVKELQFSIDDTNYLNFLQSILDKHGQDQYQVSAKKQFTFKYMPPKEKKRASDTMDVDNKADYKEMVKKIQQSKPSSTKILVDMKDIEKLPA
ncbi:hypothetical protein JVT61DRAFT_11437 [Boletus reticuloceps]|uniref:Uncharacterized protein n=1 Tax=Boletus reticuloceps TaxID=495285 RepID=A0A8I2YUW4_9AGAM|nr:hypothetical protein JVT61DRAFT_11437 [Boletus reticuloceps]